MLKVHYDYCEHIESIMKAYPNNTVNFIYKRRVLQDMTQRTKEVYNRGLKDEKVCHDLMLSEFSEKKILDGYHQYLEDLKEKKLIKYSPMAAAGIIILSILIFVVIGLLTDIWHPTWLIVEGTASCAVVSLMWIAVYILHRHRILYALSRALVAGSTMVLTQFAFLVLRIPFGIEKSYLIFLASLACMFIGDLILATLTKQRLVFINYLITIPIVFIFIYVIFGLLRFYTWEQGEIIIGIAFIIDILVALGMYLNNRRYAHKPEVEDVWKEN